MNCKRLLMLLCLILLGFMVMSATGIFAANSIQVLYECNGTATTTNSIRPWIELSNAGTTAISLSTVTVRYWYTIDTTQSQAFVCDYAQVGAANVTGTFVSMSNPTSTADTYLQVGFTSGAGSLAAGANTGEIQLRFNKTDWSNYNQSNDYSFNPAMTSYTLNPTITAYVNGVLVYGAEPGGSTAAPTATIAVTPTATPVLTATPTPVVTTTPTPTHTATPVVTATPTPTHTATPVVTATPTPTHTATPVVTATPTPTHTATPVVTATPTPTHTATPVVTATPIPTNTATPVVTATPTPVITATSTPVATITPTPSPVTSPSGFVTRVGHRLECNGQTFYETGSNQYYLFYKSNYMVDNVLQDAQTLGLKVMRTWGFCDGVYEGAYCFQPSPGVYDEATFENMDYTIYEAKQYGLKLIIPLVNNWDDMGGMDQYVAWAGVSGHDSFYTNSFCQTTYKNYVNYFLNRVNTLTGVAYKNDPTIMAWELANEPRCASDTTGVTLQNWISMMAAYIKSIDSNHLVSTGEEGFYVTGGEGTDFIKNNEDPNIDFCSAHLYPDGWQLTEAQSLAWIDQHTGDAHNVIGKPFYLGEFGLEWIRSGGTSATRDATYTAWYNELNLDNADGCGFWILSGYQDDGTLYPDYDNFTVYITDTSTCAVISNYSATVAAKSGITFDNTPPTETITAPANNASVSGTVQISGTAADNISLANVQICFDGGDYRPTSGTAASWSYAWDATKVLNGAHTITVMATDGQGNTSTTTINVTVTGNSGAIGNWPMTGYKTQDGGYWFIYYLTATNNTGVTQTGDFVFYFFITPEGTTTIQGSYDDSSTYGTVTSSSGFTTWYGTTQYYTMDLGTRTVNSGQYIGVNSDFGQSNGGLMSYNDWSSSQFTTATGPITHVALYKDGVLVAGFEP